MKDPDKGSHMKQMENNPPFHQAEELKGKLIETGAYGTYRKTNEEIGKDIVKMLDMIKDAGFLTKSFTIRCPRKQEDGSIEVVIIDIKHPHEKRTLVI